MTTQQFLEREHARADRLYYFVAGEVREMNVEARLNFTVKLFGYLRPELEELIKQHRIAPVKEDSCP